MNEKRLSIMSTALTIAIIAIMLTPVYADPMYNFDTETGTCTIAEAAVCGNQGFDYKLYSPAAYVKGTIHTDLPSGCTLKIQYRFEWMDENYVVHTQNGTAYSSATKAGQWISVEPSGLPCVVIYIFAEGRAGYGNVWDTDWACASLPWN